MSRTTENVVVIIIMVAIVVGLLCFVGYDNVEAWLSSPFVWKEPDYLSIEYAGTYDAQEAKKPNNFNKYILFTVRNNSDHDFNHYVFQVVVDGKVIELSSLNGSTYPANEHPLHSGHIEPNGNTTLAFICSKYNLLGEESYDLFKDMSDSDIQKLEYRVVKLYVGEDTIFSNNGWGKIITILVASLVLGLLGFAERFPVGLRIVLKVCGLPIVLFLLFIFLWSGHQEERRKEEQRRKRR